MNLVRPASASADMVFEFGGKSTNEVTRQLCVVYVVEVGRGWWGRSVEEDCTKHRTAVGVAEPVREARLTEHVVAGENVDAHRQVIVVEGFEAMVQVSRWIRLLCMMDWRVGSALVVMVVALGN